MRFVASFVIVVGCVRAAPVGFPSGDRWTFPLVDPLAEDRLVVPVVVGGHGPYLFAIDPDAPRTIVDRELVPAGARRYCDDGTATGSLLDRPSTECMPPPKHARELTPDPDVELVAVEIGDLALEHLRVRVAAPHVFDGGDRKLSGVLGGDVIDPGFVFGFDRDRGIAWLATPATFRAGDRARAIALDEPIRVDGVEVAGTVDLGHVESRFAGRATASRIDLGGITRTGVTLAPAAGPGDARLGLGFFRAFAVAIDRRARRLYLTARDGSPDTRAARLRRWGASLPRCASTGCVHVALATTSLTVSPEVATPLQVLLRATTPRGETLPDLELALPAGSPRVATELDPRYAGATLEVVDASPFPRRCPGRDACVLTDSSLSARR